LRIPNGCYPSLQRSQTRRTGLLQNKCAFGKRKMHLSGRNTKLPQTSLFSVHQDKLLKLTNFTPNEILGLWRPLDALYVARKKKGPPPKFNTLDSLVICLIFYKSDLGFETLSVAGCEKKYTGGHNSTNSPFALCNSREQMALQPPKTKATDRTSLTCCPPFGFHYNRGIPPDRSV